VVRYIISCAKKDDRTQSEFEYKTLPAARKAKKEKQNQYDTGCYIKKVYSPKSGRLTQYFFD